MVGGILVYRLGSYPGGVWTDEVETTLAGGRLLDKTLAEKRFVPFSPEATGHPAGSLLINGISWRLLGGNETALRLPAILAASLATVVFYFLLADSYGKAIAIAGSSFFGGSYWLISLARIGYDAAYFWLVEVLILLNLYRFWKNNENKNLVGVVFWLGWGVYTYLAFRVIGIGVIIVITGMIIGRGGGKLAMIKRWAMAIFLLGVIVTPLAFYARRNPETVFGRANDVSIFNHKFDGQINRLAMIAENSAKTLGIFFWQVDPNHRHNIAQRPVLNTVESVLLVAGIMVMIKRKKYFWLTTILVLGGISAASGIFTYEPPYKIQPHSLRILGLMPLVYLAIAEGLTILTKKNWVLGLILAVSVGINWKSYFGAEMTKEVYESFQGDQTRAAKMVAENCGQKIALSASLISKPHLDFFAPGCGYETFRKEEAVEKYLLNKSDFEEFGGQAIEISYRTRLEEQRKVE